MNNDRSVIFALGLAQKAGKIASGDFAVKSALKGGKVKLLIIASDASDNSKKDIYYLAGLYSVKTIEILDREQLGMAIGKAKRTAIAVLDANFANMMKV
ncbi:MAG: ribosomal L7Ae/L30e/S12e/Gadd45 family protein [Acidaminococcaceae bacterium]|nr:ribosomal L7Ae/L30e/S12e/Gadd45 family protein [Acidaminococcaceae bacterium]MBP8742847.1 ribosomal L7Ae/L30e/S12e/Gadd45 family protein [Acidaminococcaceae bacterium]